MDKKLSELIDLAKECPPDDPEWNTHLNNLVIAVCKYPPESLERRRGTHEILRIMQKSKIFRQLKNQPCYEDALQDTWSYFFPIRFCDYKQTGEQTGERTGGFMAWFNVTLRWRILKLSKQAHEENLMTVPTWQNQEGEFINPINQIPAFPDPIPALKCWERLQEWVNEDPEGTLRNCHVGGNPRANCQKMTQCLLFEGRTWGETAQEVNSVIPTIQRRYRDNCRPLLRQWLEAEGNLDDI